MRDRCFDIRNARRAGRAARRMIEPSRCLPLRRLHPLPLPPPPPPPRPSPSACRRAHAIPTTSSPPRWRMAWPCCSASASASRCSAMPSGGAHRSVARHHQPADLYAGGARAAAVRPAVPPLPARPHRAVAGLSAAGGTARALRGRAAAHARARRRGRRLGLAGHARPPADGLRRDQPRPRRGRLPAGHRRRAAHVEHGHGPRLAGARRGRGAHRCWRRCAPANRSYGERCAGAVAQACDDLAALGFCRSRGDWQRDVHAVAVPMRAETDGEILSSIAACRRCA